MKTIQEVVGSATMIIIGGKTMTKKDYELIAGSLQMTNKWTGGAIRQDLFTIICENMANTLQRNNDKFDRQRFLNACGITDFEYSADELDEMRQALRG